MTREPYRDSTSPPQEGCECGHALADHVDCGAALVCLAMVGPAGEHPFDGVCTCCGFEPEEETP